MPRRVSRRVHLPLLMQARLGCQFLLSQLWLKSKLHIIVSGRGDANHVSLTVLVVRVNLCILSGALALCAGQTDAAGCSSRFLVYLYPYWSCHRSSNPRKLVAVQNLGSFRCWRGSPPCLPLHCPEVHFFMDRTKTWRMSAAAKIVFSETVE